MSEEPAHQLQGYRDERGVVAWCSCNAWGYAGPDENKACDLYAEHVQEDGEAKADDDAPQS